MKVNYENLSSKKACIKATFDAGSNVEFDGTWPYGIAHFVEHMVFLGAKEISPDELNRQMATLGADWNAATYQDKVCFYVVVPAENIIKASELLKKIVFDGEFTEELFIKEKLVVLEEESGAMDDVDNCMSEKLDEFLCVGPYSKPILGTKESIKSITLNDIKKFHKKYYRPERLLLTITGPEELNINEITKIFGENDNKFISSKKYKTTFSKGSEKVVYDKRINQARACVCFKSCSISSPDSLTLNFMNKFFGEFMDSRLFQKVRQEKGLCYAVSGYLSLYKEIGWYSIFTKTKKENVEEAITIIEQEIDLLLKDGPTDEEMIRARNKYKSEIYSITETSYGLNALLNGRAYYGLPDLSTSIDRINNMTKDEVNGACQKLFKAKNKQIFTYLPEGEGSEEETGEE